MKHLDRPIRVVNNFWTNIDGEEITYKSMVIPALLKEVTDDLINFKNGIEWRIIKVLVKHPKNGKEHVRKARLSELYLERYPDDFVRGCKLDIRTTADLKGVANIFGGEFYNSYSWDELLESEVIEMTSKQKKEYSYHLRPKFLHHLIKMFFEVYPQGEIEIFYSRKEENIIYSKYLNIAIDKAKNSILWLTRKSYWEPFIRYKGAWESSEGYEYKFF